MRYLFLFFLIISCSSKTHYIKRGSPEDIHVINVVTDYMNNKYFSEDVYGYFITTTHKNNTIGVSISGDNNKVIQHYSKIIPNPNYFPNKYLELDNKVFYWTDSTVGPNKRIIPILKKHDLLDTTKYDGKSIPDLNKKFGKMVHYYFCKDDYSKYVKIDNPVNIMGEYPFPKLECK